jgi:hypothetical protein
VQNTLKPKLIKTRGFNYADLAKWTMEHREIPDDWNEPFVIDSFIQVNDVVPTSSTIRITISTKNLIGLARNRKHICADGTYKLIWEGI